MEELFESIENKMSEFYNDLKANVEQGNKSAGARARKASLKLEKLVKQYRKESVKTAK